MLKTKSQKIFLVFFTFSLFFFSCDTKKKKTDELAHLIQNARTVHAARMQMKQLTGFLPEGAAKTVDLTAIKAAQSIPVSEGEKLATSAVNSVGLRTVEASLSEEERKERRRAAPAVSRLGTVTTVSPAVAMSTVVAATSIASALGEDTSSIPMGSSLGGLGSFGLSSFDLVGLSCKEFLKNFDKTIDDATEAAFKKKKQKTYSLTDLVELRETVLTKAWTAFFADLDQGSDGLSKEEIKNFLVAKTPLSICETQSGFSKLLNERAQFVLKEFSSDGKKLTKKEFLKLARTLQRLHDKIVTDLFPIEHY